MMNKQTTAKAFENSELDLDRSNVSYPSTCSSTVLMFVREKQRRPQTQSAETARVSSSGPHVHRDFRLYVYYLYVCITCIVWTKHGTWAKPNY
ncbi:hypothetical protein ACLOJK_010916 [Asimina triloba]